MNNVLGDCPCLNHFVGIRELVVVKALEWRLEWFEGTEKLYVVSTDNKNLAFSQLNVWTQDRLIGLFFNFMLTYHPVSQNVKLDALSHQHVFAAVTWEIEFVVREVQQHQLHPGNGPASSQDPLNARLQVCSAQLKFYISSTVCCSKLFCQIWPASMGACY